MEEVTKATHRRTPSFHQHPSGQSPRVGVGGSSCAGAFYHMIDWNLSKRFSSTTKRISAGTPVNQLCKYTRKNHLSWHGEYHTFHIELPTAFLSVCVTGGRPVMGSKCTLNRLPWRIRSSALQAVCVQLPITRLIELCKLSGLN